MNPRLQISRSAVELIKAFEGFRAKAAQLQDGSWTIGYGHTLTARKGASITEADAEALLLYDLINISHAVNEWTYTPLTQHEFDALVSFAFNIGLDNFRHSATLRRLNEGRKLEAALAMELWRKTDLDGSRIVIDALVRRRAAEKAMFLKPMDGWVPAPSSVLAPKVDYDAAAALPLETPAVFRTDLSGEHAAVEREDDVPAAPAKPAANTEQAAAAVIARLEAILPEKPAATHDADEDDGFRLEPPQLHTPDVTPEAETPLAFQTKTPTKRVPPSLSGLTLARLTPLLFLLLGAVGVGLVVWGVGIALRPPTDQVLGVPASTAGGAIAILGVIGAAVALYFLLDRIGRANKPLG